MSEYEQPSSTAAPRPDDDAGEERSHRHTATLVILAAMNVAMLLVTIWLVVMRGR